MILLRAGGLPTTGQISRFEIAFGMYSLSEILILRFFKIKIVTFDFIYCEFMILSTRNTWMLKSEKW